MVHTYRSFGYGRHARLGHFVGAAIWGIFPASGFVSAITERNAALFLGVVGFSVLWMWPFYTDLLRRTYEIRLSDIGGLQFEAPLRTFRLGAHDVVSIRRAKWTVNDQAYLAIRHRRGKFWLAWPLNDFDDFIERLQALNPAVAIEESDALAPTLPEKSTATTLEVIRESPFGAAIVLAIVGGVCFLVLNEHLGPVGAIATGLVIWIGLMFGVGRGWVTFDD